MKCDSKMDKFRHVRQIKLFPLYASHHNLDKKPRQNFSVTFTLQDNFTRSLRATEIWLMKISTWYMVPKSESCYQHVHHHLVIMLCTQRNA